MTSGNLKIPYNPAESYYGGTYILITTETQHPILAPLAMTVLGTLDSRRSRLCSPCRLNHDNPVSHGLVATSKDRHYSSLHRYVREGICPDLLTTIHQLWP